MLFDNLFNKHCNNETTKPKTDFEEDIWKSIMSKYHVTPIRTFAEDKSKYYMWIYGDKLFIAPRLPKDENEIMQLSISKIKNYYINPKDHNEICLNYSDEQGKKYILKFRSQALENLRRLFPQLEYQFDRKTMELGKESRVSPVVKVGDLRDVRSGGEFEEYLTTLFQALGYKAENTKISGDQGIDVLVSKNGKKYGIQAKYYSQPVGNSAVQEVLAGREYFKLSKGIVITNASYTKSAIDLAEKTHIRLIDGEELEKIISMAKSGKGNTFVI